MSSASVVAAGLVALVTLTIPAWAQAPSGPTPAPAPLVQVADTPPRVGAALVIAPPGGLCRELVTQFATVGGPRGDLRDRCTELVQNASKPELVSAVRIGLEQMAGVQGTALATAKVKSAVQFANLTARLATLRLTGLGGGPGGLALDPPEPLPGPRVASLGGGEVAQATGGGTPSIGQKWGVFLSGAGTTGDLDRTGREAGLEFDGGGVTGGADYRLTPHLIVGLALGYGATSGDFQDGGGTVDVDDLSLSLYGTYYAGNRLYVDGIATVGWSRYDLRRRIRYSIPTVPSVGAGITTVDQTAAADPDGLGFGIGTAAGYDFHWGAFTAGPIARLSYTWSEVDGYRERIRGTAAGFGLALDVERQTVESLIGGLGAQLSYAIGTAIGVIVPQLRFEWAHEFLNDARTYRSRFVNDPTPSAGTTIQWSTDAPDRDFFSLGVGVSATFARGISAFVYYETVLDLRDVAQHRLAGGVRMEF